MRKVFKTSKRKRDYAREYRARRKKDVKWRRAQKKYMLAYQRKHALRMQLQRKGLTLKDYDRVVSKQGKTCAICRGPPDGLWKKYSIDHCRKTGKMRGLLCNKCNLGIGYFRDNPLLLKKAIAYLRR